MAGPRTGSGYFNEGRVRESYTAANGLATARLGSSTRPGGSVWAATDGGLSVIRQGRVATLAARMACPATPCTGDWQADDRSNWLYMPCGLVRIARTELDAWIADPKHTPRTTLFDGSDGVRLHWFRMRVSILRMPSKPLMGGLVCVGRGGQRDRPPASSVNKPRRRCTSSGSWLTTNHTH